MIGSLSASPLLLILPGTGARHWPVLAGTIYGAAYYVAINSLALPIYFIDHLPWKLGAATVLPSLSGRVVFGAVFGWTSRRFISTADPQTVPG